MAEKKQQTSTKPTMENWNAAGGRLSLFSKDPPTGFYRDGYCRTGPEDKGKHTIAATVTQPFLDFSASKGNNLKDKGITDGMKWCLCAHRWQEAMQAAQNGELKREDVPKVHIHATDKSTLDTVTYKDLKAFAAESEAGNSGRQGSHHNPEEHRGIAGTSKEIGGDQPTEAPGAGKNQSKGGEITQTDSSRG
ncbi:hypothetical protein LTR37_017986 [Vermiconidia calcicola]|uniref:Uncharacterized protein n=1 Tax=Vermiconidia calcicola TaxID=1690605 RepID=A0ACC3MIF2_9PEZI|nr:hypothetical protein LTR37_017986 [Vermiconidia calcicola]